MIDLNYSLRKAYFDALSAITPAVPVFYYAAPPNTKLDKYIVYRSITNKDESTKQTGIIKTKYGYCYYHADTKKYTNIESYLKWKKLTVEKLCDKDIIFIKSLPKKLKDGTELHIGPYGLYIKDKNKNMKLDKDKWESFIS